MSALNVITFLLLCIGWWILHDIAMACRPAKVSYHTWALITLIAVLFVPFLCLTLYAWAH